MPFFPTTPRSGLRCKGKRKAFLLAYPRAGTIAKAAQEIGVSDRAVRWWVSHDPVFAEELRLVEQQTIELIEAEIQARAMDRTAQSSAQLLMFLAKRHRPELYDPIVRAHSLGVNVAASPVLVGAGATPEAAAVLTDEELAWGRRIAEKLRKVRDAKAQEVLPTEATG